MAATLQVETVGMSGGGTGSWPCLPFPRCPNGAPVDRAGVAGDGDRSPSSSPRLCPTSFCLRRTGAFCAILLPFPHHLIERKWNDASVRTAA